MTKAFIVDIDGTLALMKGVRGPFEWDKVHLDNPNQWVIDLVKDIQARHLDWHTIIMSGRLGSETCEQLTRQWLTSNGIVYTNLFMRPSDREFDKDCIIKKDLYEQYVKPHHNVQFVIDDRDQVVKMWRNELGLKVLQVAEGDF